MQLHYAFGAPILRPVKDRGTEFDQRGIQTQQLVLKAEAMSSSRVHFRNSVMAIETILQQVEYGPSNQPALPDVPELHGRAPIAFKSYGSNPNPARMEVRGRIGGTTFYGFKEGRWYQ